MLVNQLMSRRALVGLLLALCCVFAVPATSAADLEPLDIRVIGDKWDGANKETIDRLLHSVAKELHEYFPGRKFPPILVEGKGGPIVLFRRGKNGEIFVRLNTGGTYWAQYSYQFSHEFCHILCKYDQDKTGNKWFEETICETASLFTLRKMGRTWKTDPPYKHWKNFSRHLTSYAKSRMDKHPLPDGQSLREYFDANKVELYRNATNRELNTTVAAKLLPLFEASPTSWEAVQWLNAGKPTKPQTFEVFLKEWHGNVPEKHRAFVTKVAAAFEIEVK